MFDMLKLTLSQYGIKEIRGEKDNPEILKYFAAMDLGKKDWKDETAWCSALMNWAAKESGYEYSNELTARSWLKLGKKIDVPFLGCLVIFWRDSPESWKGHIGQFVAKRGNLIYTAGGNQGNMVNISPYSAGQLLEFRELTKVFPDVETIY